MQREGTLIATASKVALGIGEFTFPALKIGLTESRQITTPFAAA